MTEEQRDNLLGGLAIILLGILLGASAIWGLVYNVYSINSGLAVVFIILGIGSIMLGLSIAACKPEEHPLGLSNETRWARFSQGAER